ncbi:acetyl-CoA C-acyltransferase [Corynebacterium liangguodongii]|uniref:Probable acetyl-CoA acetyltransferase n=1 Tax=Corynebacterium liangguodongii TaxID=2079535 RepID=A0A2S0WGM9_9CORY|nr:acetyl-CoA C-acyltransferase [Corynebacterium liangguodongii]AWB84935.1 acetyl-CoA C-acyltransferase [Corynebacterium liangguodongii]PWB99357.1 acetyl-CoA C-acyltransferase [Corynebacterium liangguodongii]
MDTAYILSSARTAIGSFMGSLSAHTPTELGIATAEAAIERAGVDPEVIDTAVYGNVINTETNDAYLARAIALGAGMGESSTANNINRLCGSGVQSIISGAHMIREGDAAVALVGGAEVMSRAPYSLPRMRAGQKMGDGRVVDWLGILSDPFGNGHMGNTAEEIARRQGYTREQVDEYALDSHTKALAAIKAGAFDEQIVPVEVRRGKETVKFCVDEHPRETTLEKLGSLRPAFQEGGLVTAGNASGINDGAASLVLAGEGAVDEHDLSPVARILGWGISGCDPSVMGLGPVAAVPKALAKAGVDISDIDLIESNEAFAAQAMAVSDQLGFDPAKTNIHGGAVALGHPVGATGAILTTKLLHQLHDNDVRYGLVTLCIGGGQGIALVIESLR